MVFCLRIRVSNVDMLQRVMARFSSRYCPRSVSLHTQGGLHVPSGALCSSLPAIGCKRPEIENGKTTGLETVYRLADTIVFECNFGYALKGSQESQCQFGGTWDPPVPVCEKSKCN